MARITNITCGIFETNAKLDNKPKTRKQKIVGWVLSIVVCLKQTQNSETKLRQMTYRWNRHRS